ncbi:hypothetical protein HRbin39_01285 [bacterium HR39]|nr:hypothetical protein HRbin39_01285 [bacterium HR39]
MRRGAGSQADPRRAVREGRCGASPDGVAVRTIQLVGPGRKHSGRRAGQGARVRRRPHRVAASDHGGRRDRAFRRSVRAAPLRARHAGRPAVPTALPYLPLGTGTREAGGGAGPGPGARRSGPCTHRTTAWNGGDGTAARARPRGLAPEGAGDVRFVDICMSPSRRRAFPAGPTGRAVRPHPGHRVRCGRAIVGAPTLGCGSQAGGSLRRPIGRSDRRTSRQRPRVREASARVAMEARCRSAARRCARSPPARQVGAGAARGRRLSWSCGTRPT